MLRMGKLTDYATVVLAHLAQDPFRHRSAAELADSTRLARPTVSKVLKGLQRAGMVISSRGAQGGYHLARRPEDITATQILDVFEGPIAIHRMQRRGQPLRHRAAMPRRRRLAARECRDPPWRSTT